jgi:hypothetical protein
MSAPDGRMALSCCKANTVSFINKAGVELFECKHVLLISTPFSICFTPKNVCRSDADFSMFNTFLWYFSSLDVLYSQMVEWHCPVAKLILSALSTKQE